MRLVSSVGSRNWPHVRIIGAWPRRVSVSSPTKLATVELCIAKSFESSVRKGTCKIHSMRFSIMIVSLVDDFRTLRSPACRLGRSRGAGSLQRQRSAGSGFVCSDHTADCDCASGAATAHSARHARCGHSHGTLFAYQ